MTYTIIDQFQFIVNIANSMKQLKKGKAIAKRSTRQSLWSKSLSKQFVRAYIEQRFRLDENYSFESNGIPYDMNETKPKINWITIQSKMSYKKEVTRLRSKAQKLEITLKKMTELRNNVQEAYQISRLRNSNKVYALVSNGDFRQRLKQQSRLQKKIRQEFEEAQTIYLEVQQKIEREKRQREEEIIRGRINSVRAVRGLINVQNQAQIRLDDQNNREIQNHEARRQANPILNRLRGQRYH